MIITMALLSYWGDFPLTYIAPHKITKHLEPRHCMGCESKSEHRPTKQVVGNKLKFVDWKSIFGCHPREATAHLGFHVGNSHFSLTLYIFNIWSGSSTSALVLKYAKIMQTFPMLYYTHPPPQFLTFQFQNKNKNM